MSTIYQTKNATAYSRRVINPAINAGVHRGKVIQMEPWDGEGGAVVCLTIGQDRDGEKHAFECQLKAETVCSLLAESNPTGLLGRVIEVELGDFAYEGTHSRVVTDIDLLSISETMDAALAQNESDIKEWAKSIGFEDGPIKDHPKNLDRLIEMYGDQWPAFVKFQGEDGTAWLISLRPFSLETARSMVLEDRQYSVDLWGVWHRTNEDAKAGEEASHGNHN